MKVLVINCGSSSLKYQLIDMENESVLAKGLCERIGIEGSALTHKPTGKDKYVVETAMPDHSVAVKLVLDALMDSEHGVIENADEITAIGHRVLHGGAKISDSCIINDEVISVIEECCDLGPLHNPANLMGIRACMELMPGKPNVAVFDTAFHQTMPEKAYMYAIPKKYYDEYKVRKYGFHGTSHRFVSKETIKFLGLDPENSKVIVAHLGNGSSISAVVNGKCVDTSMGLTPLQGLVMGTRSGDLDPAVLEFICAKENIDVKEMVRILNKESGLLGLSNGLSSDFRDLNEAAEGGNEDAKRAVDCLCYSIIKYIGSYVAAMNGVDAIAFTGGIGENAIPVRETVVKSLGYLGIKLDEEANQTRGENKVISTADSKVKVAIVPTNEELAICQETAELVKNQK